MSAGGRPTAIPLAPRRDWWLGAALLLGLAVRLYFLVTQRGIYHPDEVYQYVEPAYYRIHGVGVLAWEFQRGVRNWVLPGYLGALMELGRAIGLRGLALYRFLQGHDALLSLLLVPAGWKLGRLLQPQDPRLRRLLALAFAAFPLFGEFGPRTLSESFGLLATTWAVVYWVGAATEPDRRRRLRAAFWAGVLLGVAGVVRYTLLLFAVPVLLDLFLRLDWRALGRCALGLALVMAALGAIDAVTWGQPFHTLIEYVRFNQLEHGADVFGVAPADFYWRHLLVAGLGATRFLLLVPALALAVRHWRLLLAWMWPLAALSLIPHKEERFVLSIWPFVLASGLVGSLVLADAVARWAGAPAVQAQRLGMAWAGAVLLLACGSMVRPATTPHNPNTAGILAAQDAAGREPDASGLLIGDQYAYPDGFVWTSGGYTVLDRDIPQLALTPELLEHRLFNYVIAAAPSVVGWLSGRPDFVEVARFDDDVRLYRRRHAPPASGEVGLGP